MTVVDDSPTEITWSTWQSMTPAQRDAIPKALITDVPGCDISIRADLMTTLWTNPNPSSSEGFAAQNITLSSSDYDFLLFVAFRQYNASTTISMIIPKESSTTLFHTANTNNGAVNVIREVVRNSDTIFSVGDCYIASGSSSSLSNLYIIPTVVYGIKKTIEFDFSSIASDVSSDAKKCILTNGNNIEKIIRNTNLSSRYSDSLSITDVNNCPPGLCSSTFTANTPSGSTENLYVFSMAMNEDMDYCKQIAWSMTDNSKIYTRQCFSGIWGIWDVLETSSKTAVVTGTLSSDSSFVTVAFPSGFNKDNCMVVSWMVEATNEGWRTGQGIISQSFYRTFVMLSSSVQIYNNDPALYSKSFKIMLKKI